MAHVHDAAALPGGLLVAFGEGGVELIEAPAKRHRFECPANALAVSGDGSRAIAIAPTKTRRDQLHRIDLVRRHAEPWCSADLRRVARTFQGPLWYVAVAGSGGSSFRPLAVRHEADGFEIVAEGPQPEGDPSPLDMRLRGDRLYVTADDWFPLYVTFELPSLRLVAYDGLQAPHMHALLAAVRFGLVTPAADEPVYLCKSRPSFGGARLVGREGTWIVSLPGHALAFDAVGPWAAVLLWVGDRCVVQCFRIGDRLPCWVFTFAAPTPMYDPASDEQHTVTPLSTQILRGGLRLEKEQLVAWDTRGEVVAFDLARHEVIVSARL